jgi:hypothetical protein
VDIPGALIPVFGPARAPTAGTGQKQSLAGTIRKVRLPIRKLTFAPIAAAHKDLFVGYVGFAIWKRKQFVGADFVAL